MKALTAITVFLPLLLACGAEEKDDNTTDSGNNTTDSGEADTDTDTDADTDTDTDTDSDTDTDTDTDTGGNPALAKYNGTWIGALEMEGTAAAMGMSDSCEGIMTLAMDNANVGEELNGTFDCTWAGNFAAVAKQFGDGKVEGTIDSNDFSLSGGGWYGPMEITWEGEFNSDTEATGSWEGVQPADSSTGLPEIAHSGNFNLLKQ
jgi:hypothetical protein